MAQFQSTNITGSFTVITGSAVELQVTNLGVNIGSALTDSHIISGSLRVNPNGLFVSGSGNVGVGTTSPSANFHIQSSASGGQNLRIQTSIAAGRNYVQWANGSGDMGYIGYGGADGKFWINNQLNDDMLFHNNGSERMRITSGGNVGIGLTSPSGPLHVYRSVTGGLGGHIILDNNGSAVGNETALLFSDGSITNTRAAISSTVEGEPYFGDIKFKTGLSAYSSLNTRMTIKGNGFVGIGTTPLYLLHIPQDNNLFLSNLFLTGTANNPRLSSGATGGSMSLEGGGAAEGKIYLQGAGSGGDGYIQFFAGGAERARINSAGNVLINTTSDIGERLTLNGRIGIVGATVASGNTRSFFVRGAQNVADGGTLALNVTNSALVFIAENNTGTGALFFCGYASATITKISDPSNIFDTADTAGKLCFFKSAVTGDATVRNRLGSTRSITVSYIGVSD